MLPTRIPSAPAQPPASRLFVALWPGERTRARLAAWGERTLWPPGARPIAPGRLHVTLHFIGAYPTAELDALRAALPPAARAFELAFDRLQLWRGGLLVLCPAEVPEPLRALHGQLAQALRERGIPVESRPLRPHVTLARHWPPGQPPPAPPPALRWPVRGHVLVQSMPDGHYRLLQRYPAGVCTTPRAHIARNTSFATLLVVPRGRLSTKTT